MGLGCQWRNPGCQYLSVRRWERAWALERGRGVRIGLKKSPEVSEARCGGSLGDLWVLDAGFSYVRVQMPGLAQVAVEAGSTNS